MDTALPLKAAKEYAGEMLEFIFESIRDEGIDEEEEDPPPLLPPYLVGSLLCPSVSDAGKQQRIILPKKAIRLT